MNPHSPIHLIAIIAALLLLVFGLSAEPARASQPSLPAAQLAALNQDLINAAAQGKIDSVSLDVYRGADVNAVDRLRRTPLAACAAGEGPEANRLRIVKLLVGLGADVNQHSVFQPTPLLIAIDYSQSQIANYLLTNGADPTTFDSEGDCALTHAARTGQLDIVKALIARGADVRSIDHRGRTPLMWVSGKPATAPDDSAFDEVTPSETGYTVLRFIHNHAVDGPGGSDIVATLLAANANIDAIDNDGNTALMIAASEGKTEVVQALIDAHADWRRHNDFSDNALMCAEKAGYADTVAYLKTIGGAKDPVYLALEKRTESAKVEKEKDIEALSRRRESLPQSNLPGVSLNVYADSEFVSEGKPPTLHYYLENNSSTPVTLISAADNVPGAPSAAKAAWSVAQTDKNPGAHPDQPDFVVQTPSGGTISAIANIGLVTIPPNGRVELPVNAILSPIADGSSKMSAPGIYKAAFYYIDDPYNLPYSTDDVYTIAKTTTPCRLVSNEITIVNE